MRARGAREPIHSYISPSPPYTIPTPLHNVPLLVEWVNVQVATTSTSTRARGGLRSTCCYGKNKMASIYDDSA